jgi:fucose permease
MGSAATGLGTRKFGWLNRVQAPVALAYAAFVLVGVSAGVNGVLLLSQMNGYGVDRATIGITFFTGSAGFVLASLSNGALIQRLGIRLSAAIGAGAFALATIYMASRPPFAAFVAIQLVTGYGIGSLESVLNTYLAALPGATTLLNRLHAFFGVGALIGPALAAWMIGFAPWTVILFIVAVSYVPLAVGFIVALPGPLPAQPESESRPAEHGTSAGDTSSSARHLVAALRDPGIMCGAVMLAVYVGLELGVGNWGFSYLVQGRGLTRTLAGYSISGYWLGLTAGRFLISPLATRIGLTTGGMMYACLAGITATASLAWASPTAATPVALVVLGFFLGPVFPTTMAIAPRLGTPELAPTAIGVLNAGSTIGGAGLPWVAGVLGQGLGIWTLMPFTVTLAVVQIAVWRPLAVRIRPASARPAARSGLLSRLRPDQDAGL